MKFKFRPAIIGASINSRSEKHGEDTVPAFDIPLSSIMLTKAELNQLMREPLTWEALFNKRKDGLAEPLWSNVKGVTLTDKYEHASATIVVGLHEETFKFDDCNIVKLRIIPCVGGLTELRMTIQAHITLTNTQLFEFMSKDCRVEFSTGKLEKKDEVHPELALEIVEPAKRVRKSRAKIKPLTPGVWNGGEAPRPLTD